MYLLSRFSVQLTLDNAKHLFLSILVNVVVSHKVDIIMTYAMVEATSNNVFFMSILHVHAIA